MKVKAKDKHGHIQEMFARSLGQIIIFNEVNRAGTLGLSAIMSMHLQPLVSFYDILELKLFGRISSELNSVHFILKCLGSSSMPTMSPVDGQYSVNFQQIICLPGLCSVHSKQMLSNLLSNYISMYVSIWSRHNELHCISSQILVLQSLGFVHDII